MSDFNDVRDFHEKFGLPVSGKRAPHEIEPDLRDFRLRFLLEELAELADGYGLELSYDLAPAPLSDGRQDLPGIADALVDLVYVALGTAHLHGLPWPALFAEVQRANMTKERATPDGSNSARGSSFDVVKPEGWKTPAIVEVLMRAGWKGPALFPIGGEKR